MALQRASKALAAFLIIAFATRGVFAGLPPMEPEPIYEQTESAPVYADPLITEKDPIILATEEPPAADPQDGVDISFLDQAKLSYDPVLCSEPDFCFYCPLAATIGGPFFVDHNKKEAVTKSDINQVGLKCLKTLHKSKFGIFLTDTDYVALGVVDLYKETEPSFKEIALTATKKGSLLTHLVCKPKYPDTDPRDAPFCTTCSNLDSRECKEEIQKLCEEGFSPVQSRRSYRTSYNFKANFLWKRLYRETPRVCKAFLSRRVSQADKHYSHVALANVIVDHCEEARRYKPCRPRYSNRGPHRGYQQQAVYGPQYEEPNSYGPSYRPQPYGLHEHTADYSDEGPVYGPTEPYHDSGYGVEQPSYDPYGPQVQSGGYHHGESGRRYVYQTAHYAHESKGYPKYDPRIHGSIYDYFLKLKSIVRPAHGPSYDEPANDPYYYNSGYGLSGHAESSDYEVYDKYLA
ncbi:hypothetical protein BSKO_06471 [Bryopsis sp. KO-2023]|nr:hypothetical protein BSKO_06471 [Bryopsis sp. KO-2023]